MSLAPEQINRADVVRFGVTPQGVLSVHFSHRTAAEARLQHLPETFAGRALVSDPQRPILSLPLTAADTPEALRGLLSGFGVTSAALDAFQPRLEATHAQLHVQQLVAGLELTRGLQSQPVATHQESQAVHQGLAATSEVIRT